MFLQKKKKKKFGAVVLKLVKMKKQAKKFWI